MLAVSTEGSVAGLLLAEYISPTLVYESTKELLQRKYTNGGGLDFRTSR